MASLVWLAMAWLEMECKIDSRPKRGTFPGLKSENDTVQQYDLRTGPVQPGHMGDRSSPLLSRRRRRRARVRRCAVHRSARAGTPAGATESSRSSPPWAGSPPRGEIRAAVGAARRAPPSEILALRWRVPPGFRVLGDGDPRSADGHDAVFSVVVVTELLLVLGGDRRAVRARRQQEPGQQKGLRALLHGSAATAAGTAPARQVVARLLW